MTDIRTMVTAEKAKIRSARAGISEGTVQPVNFATTVRPAPKRIQAEDARIMNSIVTRTSFCGETCPFEHKYPSLSLAVYFVHMDYINCVWARVIVFRPHGRYQPACRRSSITRSCGGSLPKGRRSCSCGVVQCTRHARDRRTARRVEERPVPLLSQQAGIVRCGRKGGGGAHGERFRPASQPGNWN